MFDSDTNIINTVKTWALAKTDASLGGAVSGHELKPVLINSFTLESFLC